MPASAALIARDARILAGYRAGRSFLDLALAEGLDPAVVRRVLRHHGIEPGPLRQPAPPPPLPDCLKNPDWLVERYSAGGSGETIAVDLGLNHWRVYWFLRERGVLRTLKQASVLREERRRREDDAAAETS